MENGKLLLPVVVSEELAVLDAVARPIRAVPVHVLQKFELGFEARGMTWNRLPLQRSKVSIRYFIFTKSNPLIFVHQLFF